LAVSIIWVEVEEEAPKFYIISDRVAKDANLQGRLTHWLKHKYYFLKQSFENKTIELYYRFENDAGELEKKFYLGKINQETATRLKAKRKNQKHCNRPRSHKVKNTTKKQGEE